ncbi:hypothetical protein C4D60_Mb06t32200 [Musa balbisiana]|uniref:Uncharacterized protein n=1 Tax=Musa balbisiana TaxID=52838 RepID=A0A4S8IT11_MUSBA|nr:hypothetical protein C4D60_Mb06t32200 [Musa balbisiana]
MHRARPIPPASRRRRPRRAPRSPASTAGDRTTQPRT